MVGVFIPQKQATYKPGFSVPQEPVLTLFQNTTTWYCYSESDISGSTLTSIAGLYEEFCNLAYKW